METRNQDDIIMLVVFAMLGIVLMAVIISDIFHAYSNKENEEFRLKKYSPYNKCRYCEFFDDDDQDMQIYDYAFPTIGPTDSWLSSHAMLPWWNSTRFTRNTSYDIRGDVPIAGTCSGLCGCSPWLESPLKPLC